MDSDPAAGAEVQPINATCLTWLHHQLQLVRGKGNPACDTVELLSSIDRKPFAAVAGTSCNRSRTVGQREMAGR